MRNLVLRLFTIISMVSLFSCEFDHLHFETNRRALVRVNVDWDYSHVSPNGVSAYVYDANGDFVSELLSSNPNSFDLKLAEGEYSVVIHNNSLSELTNVYLSGKDKLSTFCIYANEQDGDPEFTEVRDDEKYVHEPGDVVACVLRNIVIESSDLNYHYDKPNLDDYEQEALHTYTVVPRHIVHVSRVVAYINGLEYAKGAPIAILRGMSGGYHFGNECTTDGDVLEQFYVNTKVTHVNPEGQLIGDYANEIYVDYNTFGMHANDPENQEYHIDIRFNLLDGTTKDYNVDVTDDIHTETTDTHNIHTVEVELEPLPEVDDPDEPENPDDKEEGTFEPSLDDWVDVEVDLPM